MATELWHCIVAVDYLSPILVATWNYCPRQRDAADETICLTKQTGVDGGTRNCMKSYCVLKRVEEGEGNWIPNDVAIRSIQVNRLDGE